MLHPESTAYDLFDGKRYKSQPIPEGVHELARKSMGKSDSRLSPDALVMGVEGKESNLAVALDEKSDRKVHQVELEGRQIAVFWYGRTRSAVAFDARIDGRVLHFYADQISPETAPFKDRETGTRWTIAGRGVDGPLRGKQLDWVDSVQCKWFAWSSVYPGTELNLRTSKESK